MNWVKTVSLFCQNWVKTESKWLQNWHWITKIDGIKTDGISAQTDIQRIWNSTENHAYFGRAFGLKIWFFEILGRISTLVTFAFASIQNSVRSDRPKSTKGSFLRSLFRPTFVWERSTRSRPRQRPHTSLWFFSLRREALQATVVIVLNSKQNFSTWSCLNFPARWRMSAVNVNNGLTPLSDCMLLRPAIIALPTVVPKKWVGMAAGKFNF